MNEDPKISDILLAEKIADQLNEQTEGPWFPHGTNSIKGEQRFNFPLFVLGIVGLLLLGALGVGLVELGIRLFAWSLRIPVRLA